MRNKSRKVSKAKIRKTKRRAKLRRAIRGGAEALAKTETLNQSGALHKPEELNQTETLNKKTAALEKMKAIKNSLVYLEQGAWSGVNPYIRLKQEYKENMGKYFEESGSYALMDHIIKKGYTDDVSNPTVAFDKINRDQIVSISGIKGSDLENLCLFLYIVMCFFKRFKEDEDFVDYVNFLKEDFIPAINGNTRDTKIRKQRLTKKFITEYAMEIKENLIYGLKLDSEAFEKSRKSSFSFSLPSFLKTKKVDPTASANNTKKKSGFSLPSFLSKKVTAPAITSAPASNGAAITSNATAITKANAPAVTSAPASNGAAITSTNATGVTSAPASNGAAITSTNVTANTAITATNAPAITKANAPAITSTNANTNAKGKL